MDTSDRHLRNSANLHIGIPGSIPDRKRPVAGFFISKYQMEQKRKMAEGQEGWNSGPDAIYELQDNDIYGNDLTAQGDIEIILRKDVSGRTAYMRGDQMTSGGRPVRAESMDDNEVLDAFINADGPNQKSHIADGLLGLLNSYVNKNKDSAMSRNKLNKQTGKIEKTNNSFDAQILGGFKVSEIEGIHYPFSKIEKMSENQDISELINGVIEQSDIEQSGARQDIAERLIKRINAGKIDTPAIKTLRSYAKAMDVRKDYMSKGIGYVRFSHPRGINIDNPKTYDIKAKPNQTVLDVLRGVIKSELLSMMKKLISEEISRSGVQI